MTCVADENDAEIAKAVAKWSSEPQPVKWIDRHGECCKENPSEASGIETSTTSIAPQAKRPVDLDLLLACRQAHQEAALIPFLSNTFIFGGYYVNPMEFTQQLLVRQRRALANIVIEEPHLVAKSSKYFRSKALLPKLTGLRRLTISFFISLSSPPGPKPSLPEMQSVLDEIKNGLRGHSLAQFNMMVDPEMTPGGKALLQQYLAMVRQAETAILQAGTGKS